MQGIKENPGKVGKSTFLVCMQSKNSRHVLRTGLAGKTHIIMIIDPILGLNENASVNSNDHCLKSSTHKTKEKYEKSLKRMISLHAKTCAPGVISYAYVFLQMVAFNLYGKCNMGRASCNEFLQLNVSGLTIPYVILTLKSLRSLFKFF